MTNRVKEMRIQLGLNRIDLAKIAKVSAVTIDMLERMEGYNPRATTMKAVSDALGANINEVFIF